MKNQDSHETNFQRSNWCPLMRNSLLAKKNMKNQDSHETNFQHSNWCPLMPEYW